MANRGEWGEPYVALRLMGEQRLYMADEDGNVNQKEWMEIKRLNRRETSERTVIYNCNDDMTVTVEVNGSRVKDIHADEFLRVANLLKNDITTAKGRSFKVSKEVTDFFEEVEIKHMKAKSIEKSDVFLDTIDPRNSILREDIGFSVKCEFGENPTLFNTGRASAVKYRITSNMNDSLMNDINKIVDKKGHAAVADRCQMLKDKGCVLEYVGYEYASRAKCNAFEENLDQLNPRLPQVIERIMWNHFMEGGKEINIVDVTERIIKENPCKISRPEEKYPYMIKSFLYATYCGMTAGTVWNGKSAVKGGYITVKYTGDVIANYAMESESFKNYLYTHCYLDFPSTDKGHGAYGEVYFEDGEYYFKLNFQIRIK